MSNQGHKISVGNKGVKHTYRKKSAWPSQKATVFVPNLTSYCHSCFHSLLKSKNCLFSIFQTTIFSYISLKGNNLGAKGFPIGFIKPVPHPTLLSN